MCLTYIKCYQTKIDFINTKTNSPTIKFSTKAFTPSDFPCRDPGKQIELPIADFRIPTAHSPISVIRFVLQNVRIYMFHYRQSNRNFITK